MIVLLINIKKDVVIHKHLKNILVIYQEFINNKNNKNLLRKFNSLWQTNQ